MKIVAYNKTYNELTVLSNSGRYVYSGVSPYLYRKLNYIIKNKWYGKAWQILKNVKLIYSDSNVKIKRKDIENASTQ